jgi:hypothetical protein
MTEKYFDFIEQSLDNSSPNVLSVQGRVLDSTDERSAARVQFVQGVLRVARDGKEVTVPGHRGTRAFVSKNEVSIEVLTNDLDESGRLAPIVCHGYLGEPEIGWTEALCGELAEFASAIGRRVSPGTITEVRELGENLLNPPSRLRRIKESVTGSGHVRPPDGHVDRRESLPAEPGRRRVIVVLTDAQYRYFQQDQSLRFLLTEYEVAICRPADKSMRQGGGLEAQLDRRQLLRPGAVLIQNPYDETSYFDAEVAAEELFNAKVNAFLRLCQLLGAEKVEATSILRVGAGEGRNVPVTANAETPYGGLEISAGVKTDRRGSSAEELKFTREFAAGPPDIPAAEAHLESTRLAADTNLASLVAARADLNNPLRRQRFVIETKVDSERFRAILGRVAAPLASLNVGVDSHTTLTHYYRYQADVVFRVKK